MSEMVERLAALVRAIREGAGVKAEGPWNVAETVSARAILSTMRQPTDAMVEANWTQPISGGVDDGWRMMIDAALAP